MPRDLELTLTLDDAASEQELRAAVARRLRLAAGRITAVRVVHRYRTCVRGHK